MGDLFKKTPHPLFSKRAVQTHNFRMKLLSASYCLAYPKLTGYHSIRAQVTPAQTSDNITAAEPISLALPDNS